MTIGNDLQTTLGVLLEGWFSFTVGTSGTAATIRLRQTNVAGAVVSASGALTVVAANVYQFDARGLDAAPVLPGSGPLSGVAGVRYDSDHYGWRSHFHSVGGCAVGNRNLKGGT